jgi:hypothetical protein
MTLSVVAGVDPAHATLLELFIPDPDEAVLSVRHGNDEHATLPPPRPSARAT